MRLKPAARRLRWGRAGLGTVAGLLLAGALAGCAAGPTTPGAPAATTTSAAVGSATATAPSPTATAMATAALRAWWRRETLGIGAGGTVDVPKNPDRPGWLDLSPAPGQQGPAVIIGHLDSKTGPAVFLRLRELKVGDPVVVSRHDGTTVTFTVDGVRSFEKSHFPTEATYGPVPGPALRLITCGGTYDHATKSYESNVIVFAS